MSGEMGLSRSSGWSASWGQRMKKPENRAGAGEKPQRAPHHRGEGRGPDTPAPASRLVWWGLLEGLLREEAEIQSWESRC